MATVKMMRKKGESVLFHFDSVVYDASIFETLDLEPEAPTPEEITEAAELPGQKTKKAKPVTTDDELNTAFDIDVL